MIELGVDLLVGFLLLLTTGWCALLYRRLDRLRVERSDVETFLAAVDGAVRRAEQAVAGIRDGAAEAQRVLAAEQGQARQRAAELARLSENAERMARRVESAIHQGARTMAQEGLERGRGAVSRPERESPPAATRDPSAGDPPPRDPPGRSSRQRLQAELVKALEALR